MVRLSLIEERPVKQVRMANLAIVGTHSTNGVAAIHSELLRTTVLKDFADMFPERFNNKTNGVAPRRWLLLANPDLAGLITEAIGDGWITDLARLRGLVPLADDAAFIAKFRQAKRAAKRRSPASRRAAAKKAVRTKGRAGLRAAAKKAVRTKAQARRPAGARKAAAARTRAAAKKGAGTRKGPARRAARKRRARKT